MHYNASCIFHTGLYYVHHNYVYIVQLHMIVGIIDVEFLRDALVELIKSRHVLKASFPYHHSIASDHSQEKEGLIKLVSTYSCVAGHQPLSEGVVCCRTVMLCEVTSLTLGDDAVLRCYVLPSNCATLAQSLACLRYMKPRPILPFLLM